MDHEEHMDQVRERQDRRLEQQILLEEQEDREQAVDDHDRHQVNRGPLQLNILTKMISY